MTQNLVDIIFPKLLSLARKFPEVQVKEHIANTKNGLKQKKLQMAKQFVITKEPMEILFLLVNFLLILLNCKFYEHIE